MRSSLHRGTLPGRTSISTATDTRSWPMRCGRRSRHRGGSGRCGHDPRRGRPDHPPAQPAEHGCAAASARASVGGGSGHRGTEDAGVSLTERGCGPRAPAELVDGLRPLLQDIGAYSRVLLPSHRLRDYQIGPARAIAESVTARLGHQFAVVFSRQAGKDELLAQLIAWLLTRYQIAGGTIVVAAPTRTPQANITRDRVLDRLRRSALTVGKARTRDGYIVEVGQASAHFLSAEEGANPRGQTASLLLVANEAQDIDPAIWDARFDPMAAATNATTVFMGTVWDRNGLLHRQMEHLARLEEGAVLRGAAASDPPFPPSPPRLVFRVPWPEVAAE